MQILEASITLATPYSVQPSEFPGKSVPTRINISLFITSAVVAVMLELWTRFAALGKQYTFTDTFAMQFRIKQSVLIQKNWYNQCSIVIGQPPQLTLVVDYKGI